MSKKLLWIISIFMALAMICLILVQTYWINNAYRLKERQFSQVVNQVLYTTVQDIQEREAMWHIMDEAELLDSTWEEAYVELEFGEQQHIEEYNWNVESQIKIDGRLDHSVFIYQRSIPGTHEYELTIIADDSVIHMKNHQGIEFFDSNNLGKVSIVNPRQVKTKIEKKMADNRFFLDRMMNRMIAPELPLEKRIKPEVLIHVLEDQLVSNGIDLDYEFAVLKENLEIAFQSNEYLENQEGQYYVATLFPRDVFSRSGYLSVYFPHRTSFILRSLGFMGISSIILTLLVILGFSLTIFIIFRQKRLSEIKNDFVSNMTHELKTPISTISLASQMLNDKTIPAESKNFDNISRIIGDESKRLGYQVEKVLQMAIFDQGRIRLKRKKTDINDLVQTVVTNFDLQVKSREGSISGKYNAENAVLEVDPVHFTNVVSNLVDNAIKYSKEAPDITIETLDRNGQLVIKVSDKGIGIKKEYQRRIFEKFYRVPTGNVHNVKGFGLGLSYVKKIVEEHRGMVDLTSEFNKGTEFEISIPVNSK
ncbi:MAG TPA: HAMP domain-containing histidine kinase [Bacteroides sp.]|nr:HAMP domain-containing histidine kinase [Bacteroides sp.]